MVLNDFFLYTYGNPQWQVKTHPNPSTQPGTIKKTEKPKRVLFIMLDATKLQS